MFEQRNDLAVLWDIRVAPDARGRGVGSALFREAIRRARARGCRQLKVETQNINVPRIVGEFCTQAPNDCNLSKRWCKLRRFCDTLAPPVDAPVGSQAGESSAFDADTLT